MTTIKQYPVASFLILTVGLSFAAFLFPITGEGAFIVLLFVLAAIPTIVAFTLVMLMDGGKGAAEFLRQSLRLHGPLHWYPIALLSGFVIHLSSSVLALATGSIATIAISAPTPLLGLLIPLALLEEIGWRGLALRHLLARHSPFTATLLVGIPWALIHFALTFFFIPNRSPVVGGLIVLVGALPHTWIFVKSRHNVLVATTFHWASNVFGSVAGPHTIPEAQQLHYLLTSFCLMAIVIVLIDWRRWFARPIMPTGGEAVPSLA